MQGDIEYWILQGDEPEYGEEDGKALVGEVRRILLRPLLWKVLQIRNIEKNPLKSPANLKNWENSFEKSCKFEKLRKLLWKVLQIWKLEKIPANLKTGENSATQHHQGIQKKKKASWSSYLQELIEDVGQAAKLGGQEGSDPGVESPWNPWYTKDHGGDNLDWQMTMKSRIIQMILFIKDWPKFLRSSVISMLPVSVLEEERV